MKDFFAALGLLTSVPIPARGLDAARPPGKAFAWFPVVGVGIGLVLVLALTFFRAWFSDLIAAALVVALWALLTGALHLDGLADTGDGLAAAAPREKRLEIMRDPRVGTFGVVTVIVVLLLKFAAVASLRDGIFLALAPMLARWAMVFAAAFPLARREGMAVRSREGFGRREIFLATLVAALGAGAFGWRGIVAWIGAVIVVLILARLARNRLGGMTGDIYGAICECSEVTALMGCV